MNKIFSIYFKTIKKDLILLIAIFVILILTGFMWLGFPLYYFINTLPFATPILFPLVSAILFSLGFVYTNINVAKKIHQIQSNRSILQWTLYFQLLIAGIAFFIIFLVYMCIIYWS